MKISALLRDTSNLETCPVSETDLPFLLKLYGTTREQELAQFGWTDEQKRQFIKFQFEAQSRQYRESYPNATFDLILLDNAAIGRLYLEECQTQIRVIDIALLPQYRCQGIGSRFLRGIKQGATVLNKTVSIHVQQNNPALYLYQRLGFNKVGEYGIYVQMMWQPNPTLKEKNSNDAIISA